LAGIYIHIPFCKQACHYCNFHFTTSLRRKNELIAAIVRESVLRNTYLEGQTVETIYFGGGTPSLLEAADLQQLLDTISLQYVIHPHTEITLEANPDDITAEKLAAWKSLGINRLSIGIQSFFDEDLRWMNRAHNAEQAISKLQLAKGLFDNITIDLIYGTPTLTDEKWKANVEMALGMGIRHLSCYALTVEPKTPLHKMVLQQQKEDTDPEKQARHFLQLMGWLEKAGYEHYEISNFAQPGFQSRHNRSYWQGNHYLGLGPSAHSFNGRSRQWNKSNNNSYMDALAKDELSFETELLTPVQQYNEYVMTSLRTAEGLDLAKAGALLQATHKKTHFSVEAAAAKYLQQGKMKRVNGFLRLTPEGRLLADGIAADLFLLEDD
jgi:oxygen-independent coproporphyrinogen III oxidase